MSLLARARLIFPYHSVIGRVVRDPDTPLAKDKPQFACADGELTLSFHPMLMFIEYKYICLSSLACDFAPI